MNIKNHRRYYRRRDYIYHTAVLPEYRNQEIGQALVKNVLDQMNQLSISKAGLFIFKDNQIGNGFWDKLGFTAGIKLMLNADVVIASEDCNFAQIEVQRGIIPFGEATVRFVQAAGWQKPYLVY